MELTINSYRGLTTLINENSIKDRYKAKIKFNDENEVITGTIIYGRFKDYNNPKGYRSTTGHDLYTFSFDKQDSSGSEWCRITSSTFEESNPEGFYIEHIEIELEV